MAKRVGAERTVVLLPWVYLILRIGLALLFVYGGALKLADPKAFARVLSQYDLVPEMLLPVVAVGLPLLEVLAGIGLVLDLRGSLSVITGLLGLFIVVLWYGVLNDLEVDCGCFGPDDLNKQAGLREAFYRDLILIGVVAPYLYLSRRIRERQAEADRPRR